jgi:hypothetical protein
MGIGMVLIFYAVFLSVLAVISACLLMAATRWYLRDVPAGRKKAIVYAALFPFACVFFAGVWFVAYAVTNAVVFHHDPIIGDGWFTDIGNGYAIEMIDVTDHGIVYPRARSNDGINGPNAIQGVRRLQISGTQMFGTCDTKVFQNFGNGIQGEDEFFSLNTKNLEIKHFSDMTALGAAAQQLGVPLKLEPIASVYDKFRWGWFDALAAFTLFALPTFGFWWLVQYVREIKRESVVV